MPDTHYVPSSLSVCADMKPASQTGEPKATPMSTEGRQDITPQPAPAYELPQDVAEALARASADRLPRPRKPPPATMNDLDGREREFLARVRQLTDEEREAYSRYLGLHVLAEDVVHALKIEAKHSVWPERATTYLRNLATDLSATAPGALLSLHTTFIPSLGMTFGEAAERYVTLHARCHDINEDTDPNGEEKLGALIDQMAAIARAVSAANPLSFGDGLSVLRIASHDGSHMRESDVHAPNTVSNALFEAMLRAAAFLSGTSALASIPPADDADLFSLWNAYTTARNALNAHKGDDEGDRLVNACRSAEWAFLNTPAHTVAGIALKFRYLRDEWALDPSLRDGLPDDVLKALDTAAEAAQRLAGMPAHISSAADAELLALHREHLELVAATEVQGSRPDEVLNPLLNRLNEIQDRIMSAAPQTVAGLVAQLRVIWERHELFIEEASGPTEDSDRPVKDAWAVLKNAERLAQQPPPGSDLSATYARWREVQTFYHSESFPEEREAETLAELDALEDRLALAPVTGPADVLVKLSAFLVEMNRLGTPAIDAQHEAAWPRMIPLMESAAESFPPDLRTVVLDLTGAVRAVCGEVDRLSMEYVRSHAPKSTPTPSQAKLLDDINVLKENDPDAYAVCAAVVHAVAEMQRAISLVESHGTFPDFAARMASSLRKYAERLDQHTITQPNTFADTVAAFEAEAPKPLCMPQAPTARMVEAATAAGVTSEQAQAIYAAMAEAYRKERAA